MLPLHWATWQPVGIRSKTPSERCESCTMFLPAVATIRRGSYCPVLNRFLAKSRIPSDCNQLLSLIRTSVFSLLHLWCLQAQGIQPLVALLKGHPDRLTAELAAVALRNMSLQNKLNKEAIVAADGLVPLIALLSTGQELLVQPVQCEVCPLLRRPASLLPHHRSLDSLCIQITCSLVPVQCNLVGK